MNGALILIVLWAASVAVGCSVVLVRSIPSGEIMKCMGGFVVLVVLVVLFRML